MMPSTVSRAVRRRSDKRAKALIAAIPLRARRLVPDFEKFAALVALDAGRSFDEAVSLLKSIVASEIEMLAPEVAASQRAALEGSLQ
jgi:hypothetical protein